MTFDKITDCLMGYQLEEAEELISQLPDSEQDYSRVFKAELLRIEGKYEEADTLCSTVLNDTKDLVAKFIGYIISIATNLYLGDLKESLLSSENATETYNLLKPMEKLKIQKWYPLLFNWKGNLANLIATEDRALDHYIKAVKLYEKLNPPTRITNTFVNIASGYINIGQLDKGYEHLQRIEESFYSNLNSIGSFYLPLTLGHYYWLVGEPEKTIKYTNRARDIAYELQNDYTKYVGNCNLVTYHVDLGNLERAKFYLDECTRIKSTITFNQVVLDKIHNYYLAYYLKASHRTKNKVKAQELLEPIVYEDTIHAGITLSATTALIDILIDELRNYGEPEVLNEIVNLVDRLETNIKHQKSLVVKISVTIFRSKLALVEGNVAYALELLRKAEDIALENNVVYYLERISKERKSLEDSMIKWQDLINSGASIKERLDKLNFMEYLDEAQNFAKGFN